MRYAVENCSSTIETMHQLQTQRSYGLHPVWDSVRTTTRTNPPAYGPDVRYRHRLGFSKQLRRCSHMPLINRTGMGISKVGVGKHVFIMGVALAMGKHRKWKRREEREGTRDSGAVERLQSGRPSPSPQPKGVTKSRSDMTAGGVPKSDCMLQGPDGSKYCCQYITNLILTWICFL